MKKIFYYLSIMLCFFFALQINAKAIDVKDTLIIEDDFTKYKSEFSNSFVDDYYDNFVNKYKDMGKYYASGAGSTNLNFFRMYYWNDPDVKILMYALQYGSSGAELYFYIYNPNCSEIYYFDKYYNSDDSNITINTTMNKYVQYQVGAYMFSSDSSNSRRYIELYDQNNNKNYTWLYRSNVDIVFSTDTNIRNYNELTNSKYQYFYNNVIFGDENFSNNDIFINSKGEIFPGDSLMLKKSFNSGTNAYALGKIIWDIKAGTDQSATDGVINFKLDYGANDFKGENIPILERVVIYGQETKNSEWVEIKDDERFYFDEFNYEYYESDTILNSTLHIPNDICVYENIKVEFYFTNVKNFYMYVYDDLNESVWRDSMMLFNNYRYYEFPTDKKYAFVTHKNNVINKGKIYVPYTHIIHDDALFGAYIYDLKAKSVTKKLQEFPVEEDDYYYYYDFEYSFDNNEVLMLQRKPNTNEKIGFYVPNDYVVVFASDSEDISIITPYGYYETNSGKIDNIFSNDNKTFSDYLNIAKNFLGDISMFIRSYFNVIYYFLNKLPSTILKSIITLFIVFVACVIIRLIRR